MFIGHRMIVDVHLVRWTAFAYHFRQESLINVVIEICYSYFHRWWLSHVVLIDPESVTMTKTNSLVYASLKMSRSQ